MRPDARAPRPAPPSEHHRLMPLSERGEENISLLGILSRASACIFKGVHFHKSARRWKAQIKKNGVVRYLGLYSTPQEAHAAYVSAAAALHGQFARAD
jgi:hypothetical protein